MCVEEKSRMEMQETEEKQATEPPEEMARRAALAILAKNVAYATPAVLAILSVSVPRAKAGTF